MVVADVCSTMKYPKLLNKMTALGMPDTYCAG